MNLPTIAVLLAETPPLADAAGFPDPQTIFWRFALIVLFVLLNGFFVAAEFGLVKVRTSQLDELIGDSESKATVNRAKLAREILKKLDSYLSASQLGITICSLVLGALGEPFVHMLVEPLLGEHGAGLPEWWVKSISWAVAIGSITAVHVVIGEQMPKTLAIRRSLGTALWVGAPLSWFHWLFKPLIWLLNTASTKLLKWVFRLESAGEEHMVHSAEELRMLVEQSEEEEEVTETERDILINALELSDRIVRDIMTPRASIVALDVSRSFEENRRVAIESKHTRFPLIDKHLENTLGLVHVKDLYAGPDGGDLRALKRQLLAVPELMPLDKLLTFFLNKHAHLALVVDEFGGTIGMVTLDDVMEELVGEIHDEFDTEEKRFQELGEGEFLVDGGMPLYELSEHSPLELESDDVSTIGGYITDKLGHLPTVGEKVEIDAFDATVVKTDGHRVVQIHFKRREPISAESPLEAEAN